MPPYRWIVETEGASSELHGLCGSPLFKPCWLFFPPLYDYSASTDDFQDKESHEIVLAEAHKERVVLLILEYCKCGLTLLIPLLELPLLFSPRLLRLDSDPR